MTNESDCQEWKPSPMMQTIKAIQDERTTFGNLDETEAMTIALVMYLDKLTELGHLPTLTYEQVTT